MAFNEQSPTTNGPSGTMTVRGIRVVLTVAQGPIAAGTSLVVAEAFSKAGA